MKNECEVIFRHLVKPNDIQKIELSYAQALGTRMLRVMTKTLAQAELEANALKRAEFEAYLLRPKFTELVKEYERRWNKGFGSFSKEDWEIVENKFIKLYMKEM